MGAPSIKVKKVEKFRDKICVTGCKWSNLNAQSTETPLSYSLLEESLFPIFSPCCFLPSSLWGNKELDLPVWKVERWKIFRTKSALQAANGPTWMTQVQKPLCLYHLRNPFSRVILSIAGRAKAAGHSRNLGFRDSVQCVFCIYEWISNEQSRCTILQEYWTNKFKAWIIIFVICISPFHHHGTGLHRKCSI